MVRLRYALQEVNRSMAFEYAIRIEAGSLELTVHIAGKYEVSKRFSLRPFSQNSEALVRSCRPVKVQAVPKETPRLIYIPLKPDRVGHLLKTPAAKWRIGSPETLGSAKVGQT